MQDLPNPVPPWSQIIKRALEDIRAGAFRYPYRIEDFDGELVLFCRMRCLIDHARQLGCMPAAWAGRTMAKDRELKKQLVAAGLIVMDESERARVFERVLAGNPTPNLAAIRLGELKPWGIEP